LPFVALCKHCNWGALRENLRGIKYTILSHFGSTHNMEVSIFNLSFDDFVRHEVFLDHPYILFGDYVFSSKIAYTYDYCIAVITHSDFDSYKDASPETIHKYFIEYFPMRALDKNRTMVRIKEFEDVSDLSDRELKELSRFVLEELEKRGLR